MDHDRSYSFGEFSFLADTGELYRNGRRIRLRPQAATVLGRLLGRPGALVSREELQEALWGDTAVDAEAGLNHCVRQVRRALGDRASAPRFVATEPRRGYRFVAAVDVRTKTEHDVSINRRFETPPPPLRSRETSAARRKLPWAAAILLLGAIASFLINGRQPPDRTSSPAVSAGDEVPERAFADYQRARYLLQQGGPGPASRALPLLERVVRETPDFAAGHAALARALLQADPTSAGVRARHHVERALQISSGLAEALVVRGDIRSLIDHDWQAAELDFRDAHSAAPERTDALHHLAGLLAVIGRHDEAIRLMQQALELDPVSPLLAGDLAWFYFAVRDWQAAREWARRTLELEPAWGPARSVLLHASARLGDDDEVRLQAAATLNEAGASLEVVQSVASARDPLELYWSWWEAALAGASDPMSRVYRAWAHAALGHEEAALDELEAAAAAGDRTLVFLIRDPRFDVLRDTSRFGDVLARLGLT